MLLMIHNPRKYMSTLAAHKNPPSAWVISANSQGIALRFQFDSNFPQTTASSKKGREMWPPTYSKAQKRQERDRMRTEPPTQRSGSGLCLRGLFHGGSSDTIRYSLFRFGSTVSEDLKSLSDVKRLQDLTGRLSGRSWFVVVVLTSWGLVVIRGKRNCEASRSSYRSSSVSGMEL